MPYSVIESMSCHRFDFTQLGQHAQFCSNVNRTYSWLTNISLNQEVEAILLEQFWRRITPKSNRSFALGLLLIGMTVGLMACSDEETPPTNQPTATTTMSVAATPTQPPPTAVSVLPTPAAVSPLAPATTAALPRYGYEVVNVYPHDPAAFTQGLLFDAGMLYESTGLYGASSIRQVDLASGNVLTMTTLPAEFFGEGITIVGNRLIQLTWREQTGFIYDKKSFVREQAFSYPTEGWGITFDGERLIMSDGTARLYFWDPATLTEIGTIDVYDEKGPVVRLNELEYIQGEIFANIWQTDTIARIDPATGAVVGWIDLSGLLPAADRTASTDVLNGIAYLAEGNRLFVTGKNWPKLFEIRLVP